MKARLIARLGRLEYLEARAAAVNTVEVQIGYLKQLPADYQGQRHVVTAGQRAAELPVPIRYKFEERAGPAPIDTARKHILRVCLVSQRLPNANVVERATEASKQ